MLQAYITCTYVMEACARAELCARLTSDSHCQDYLQIYPFSDLFKSTKEECHINADQPSEVPDPFHSLGNEEFNDVVTGNKEAHFDALSSELSCLEKSHHGINITDIRHGTQPSQIQSLTNRNEKDCTPHGQGDSEQCMIRNRKFEIPELSRLFLGDTFRYLFTATACLDLYGLTWSIAAVFASSLAAEFSIWNYEEYNYLSFIGLFTFIAVPLTFIPIISQVWIQIIFFSGRMIMVLVMLGTCAAAYQSDTSHFGDQVGQQNNSTLANFSAYSS
jgi:hypothetical protein